MDEHSISSYVWLPQQLDMPICGPETAEGKMYTRAEWIVRGAADISRYDVDHRRHHADDEDHPPLRVVRRARWRCTAAAPATCRCSARWASPASTTSAGCSIRIVDYEQPRPG